VSSSLTEIYINCVFFEEGGLGSVTAKMAVHAWHVETKVVRDVSNVILKNEV